MHLRSGTHFGFDTMFLMRWHYDPPVEGEPPPPALLIQPAVTAGDEDDDVQVAPVAAEAPAMQILEPARMQLYFSDGSTMELVAEEATAMLGICVANSGLLVPE